MKKTNWFFVFLVGLFSLPMLVGAAEAVKTLVENNPATGGYLPVWFLVLSLFLPRISLLAAFFTDGAFPHLFTKLLSVPMAFFIPRVLILIAIATVMGVQVWFWIHLVMLILVWLASGIRAAASRE